MANSCARMDVGSIYRSRGPTPTTATRAMRQHQKPKVEMPAKASGMPSPSESESKESGMSSPSVRTAAFNGLSVCVSVSASSEMPPLSETRDSGIAGGAACGLKSKRNGWLKTAGGLKSSTAKGASCICPIDGRTFRQASRRVQ